MRWYSSSTASSASRRRNDSTATKLTAYHVHLMDRVSRRRLCSGRLERGSTVLYWAAVFFIIAIIAAVLGFAGIATVAAGIAKILFYVFLIFFLLALVMGIGRRGTSV